MYLHYCMSCKTSSNPSSPIPSPHRHIVALLIKHTTTKTTTTKSIFNLSLNPFVFFFLFLFSFSFLSPSLLSLLINQINLSYPPVHLLNPPTHKLTWVRGIYQICEAQQIGTLTPHLIFLTHTTSNHQK